MGVAYSDKKRNLHKTIPWPLGEKCKGNNDAHSAAISRRLEQGDPTNIRCYILIEINCSSDFLEFVLHERIIALWRQILSILDCILMYLRIPVSVVVCQSLESFVFPKIRLIHAKKSGCKCDK